MQQVPNECFYRPREISWNPFHIYRGKYSPNYSSILFQQVLVNAIVFTEPAVTKLWLNRVTIYGHTLKREPLENVDSRPHLTNVSFKVAVVKFSETGLRLSDWIDATLVESTATPPAW